MNTETAQKLMRCHRGDCPGIDDPRVQKAVRYAEGREELAGELRRQIALDGSLRAMTAALAPSEGFLDRARAAQRSQGHGSMHWRGALTNPAILAAVIALLVMLTFGFYFGMGYLQGFPGKEAVSQMIVTTDEMTGSELEQLPASTEAGEIGDWLFLHYGLEHYDVPQEFANMTPVGSRVFKQDGKAVAQIAIEQNNMIFFIFRAADFGVKLAPPERWRIFQQDEWMVALRGEDENCFMIAFRGNKAEMNAVLNPGK